MAKKGKFQPQKQQPQQSRPKGRNEQKESFDEIKKKEKAEKLAKQAQSKAKRLAKTKIISKKTKRGQPLMKDRIQYLLKQIEESKKS